MLQMVQKDNPPAGGCLRPERETGFGMYITGAIVSPKHCLVASAPGLPANICAAERPSGPLRRMPLPLNHRYAIHPMIHVGYHGRFGAEAPPAVQSPFRKHCFRPGHDIAMPMYNTFHRRAATHGRNVTGHQLLKHKALATSNFFFRGQIQKGFCSPGIRDWVHKYCLRLSPFSRCTSKRSCRFGGTMKHGIFAFAPAGWACWSTRVFDAIDALTIPVILADGVVEPFERFLNYAAFTTKLATEQLQSVAMMRPQTSGLTLTGWGPQWSRMDGRAMRRARDDDKTVGWP